HASGDGLVERALARVEQRESRDAVALEMVGLAVALVRVLVRVLLVDQEDARVLEVAARLVVAAAGLFPGRAGEAPERLEHGLLLAFLRGPSRRQDVRHLFPLVAVSWLRSY